jgi:exosortase/archaeosortase family protein
MNKFLRYLILLALPLNNLWLFYFILTPLTIYPVFWLIGLFYPASLSDTFIYFSSISIEIAHACIAGSAFYLLIILNLATPMPLKTRVYSLFSSILFLLLLNIIRIFLFSILFANSYSLFETIHLFVWNFLSIFIVIGIWFAEARIFNIKHIPFYTDIKSIKK